MLIDFVLRKSAINSQGALVQGFGFPIPALAGVDPR